MKYVYNKLSRKYDVEITTLDKCLTCLNKDVCPLLEELKKDNVMLKSSLYKEDCNLYSYFVDEETENNFRFFLKIIDFLDKVC